MNTRGHTTLTVAGLVLALTCSAVAAQNRHGGGGHRGVNFSQGHHPGGHGGGHGGGYGGSYGGGHGGHRGGGPFWGGIGLGAGLGLGLGIGLGLGTYYDTRPWYPDQVIIRQPPVVYYDARPILQMPLVSAVPSAPDPIFYPRTGQSAALTEADRQACNRWAATRPAAMADANVFQRATMACMDGRGYSSR